MLVLLLILISESVAVSVDYRSKNLREVPGDIPSDAQSVDLSDNLISNIPDDAFDNLYQITNLKVQNNTLTEFPNLTGIAGTLQTLDLTENDIQNIDPDRLNAFENLITLILHKNRKLEVFPVLTSKLASLQVLKLGWLSLSDPPVIERPQNIEFLHIGFQKISSIPDNYFTNFTSLEILWINNLKLHDFIDLPNSEQVKEVYASINDITEVPIQTMAGLVSLTTLALRGTGIRTLPPASSDYASLELRMKNCNNLDMCACDNLWIKQAEEKKANVEVPDATCGDKMWSEMTFSELLRVCTSPHTTQNNVTREYGLHPTGFFCPGPLMPEQSVSSSVTCGILCTQTPGCQSFNYLDSRCVLVAPSENEGSVAPSSHENWQFFVRV